MPRVPDYSEGAVLARKMPDGRYEVIGEVVGELEWRKEVARRAAEGKEVDDDGFDEMA